MDFAKLAKLDPVDLGKYLWLKMGKPNFDDIIPFIEMNMESKDDELYFCASVLYSITYKNAIVANNFPVIYIFSQYHKIQSLTMSTIEKLCIYNYKMTQRSGCLNCPVIYCNCNDVMNVFPVIKHPNRYQTYEEFSKTMENTRACSLIQQFEAAVNQNRLEKELQLIEVQRKIEQEKAQKETEELKRLSIIALESFERVEEQRIINQNVMLLARGEQNKETIKSILKIAVDAAVVYQHCHEEHVKNTENCKKQSLQSQKQVLKYIKTHEDQTASKQQQVEILDLEKINIPDDNPKLLSNFNLVLFQNDPIYIDLHVKCSEFKIEKVDKKRYYNYLKMIFLKTSVNQMLGLGTLSIEEFVIEWSNNRLSMDMLRYISCQEIENEIQYFIKSLAIKILKKSIKFKEEFVKEKIHDMIRLVTQEDIIKMEKNNKVH